MILYRGTKPTWIGDALFRVEGLLARVIDGGDPSRVERVGSFQAVQEHVMGRPLGGRSSFLSFTASHQTAMRYAWSGLSGDPERLPDDAYGESAIIFRLDTSSAIAEADQGVHRLEYACDYETVRPLAPTDEEARSAAAVICEYCGGRANTRPHVLRLIDVAAYLGAHPDLTPDPEAARCVARDREWLALPMDFVPRLGGSEFRIPPSRIWTAELYR